MLHVKLPFWVEFASRIEWHCECEILICFFFKIVEIFWNSHFEWNLVVWVNPKQLCLEYHWNAQTQILNGIYDNEWNSQFENYYTTHTAFWTHTLSGIYGNEWQFGNLSGHKIYWHIKTHTLSGICVNNGEWSGFQEFDWWPASTDFSFSTSVIHAMMAA